MKQYITVLSIFLLTLGVPATDEGAICRDDTKVYNSEGQFFASDFVAGGNGLTFDSSIHPDFGGAIDLENIVFPSDQPFYVDYIGEGAGANHLFGFFFLDIDTNKNGIPNFFEIADTDDMDGDGLRNSIDDDDDGDGIPDALDTQANAGCEVSATGTLTPRINVSNSAAAVLFRNGQEAADAGEHAADFWQWIPSNAVHYQNGHGVGGYIFAHPGAFLYVDNNNDLIPDCLEAPSNSNDMLKSSMPAYVVDKDHDVHPDNVRFKDAVFPALLGKWTVSVGAENRVFWLGSTIFKLADDDNGKTTQSSYNNSSPYSVRDDSPLQNAQPDYLIYGTDDETSGAIPASLLADDPEGERFWKYRWYESDISGGRELCFFLTVFYPSGNRNVNTYYSKSGFNPDPGAGSYGVNGSTKGDKYGYNNPPLGAPTSDNWFPGYRHNGQHNAVAQYAWGLNWDEIATQPTDGSYPVALSGHEAKQPWIDKWQNYAPSNMVINYIALKNWLDTAGGFNSKIQNRYGIDLNTETDNYIIRKINGKMAHMMVGAPATEEEAWLLGWEDLFNGGDRDYEDVVFYVKREARGSAQSLNVAGDLDRFDDVSIASVEFEFKDNFTEDQWNVEGNYINYFYRLSSSSTWIPLLGGEHTGTPNIFTTTEESGGVVRRHVIIQLASEGSRELYWKVEMNTNDVSVFEPEVTYAQAGYNALVHEVFYNGGVIASSNIEYYGAYETPSFTWTEKNLNRGHLYSKKIFEHGDPITMIDVAAGVNPEDHLSSAPPEPWKWDAGFSMLSQVDTMGSSRKIYAFHSDSSNPNYSSRSNLHREEFKASLSAEMIAALELDSTAVDGVIKDNFHDPSGSFDAQLASDWLATWVHGLHGMVGGVPGYEREWLLGGLNRASPAVIRPPGIPFWIDGSAIDSALKKTYFDFIDDNADIPTRILIGSESGMIHAIDGGQWKGEKKNFTDVWADGHYADFGTGREVWAMIPNNLLNDIKNNKHGGSAVAARIDSTAMITVLRVNNDWRRVALISQGENGGSDSGHVGNYVWGMDITDIDNPVPLWERTAANYNQITGQVAMAWLEADKSGSTYGGDGIWVAVYTSGAELIPGVRGSIEIVNAYTGELIHRIELGTREIMPGTPALIDIDQDGYTDWLYGATNRGRLIAFSLKDFNTLSVYNFSNSNIQFHLAPNVSNQAENVVNVVTVSGDSPLLKDEHYFTTNNLVIVAQHNTDTLTWQIKGTHALKEGHKAFARPLLAGNSLIVATTTGDTFDYCDFDPDDPGDLILFRNIFDLTDVDMVLNFGTVKAPITGGGRLHVHKSLVMNSESWNSAGPPAGGKVVPVHRTPPTSIKANIFMPFGFEEIIAGEEL